MRQGANARRSRNRSGNNNGSRGKQQVPVRLQTFDSNGPDVRIRGSALQVLEKYQALARDAQASGDRVLAENLLQHAEHYYRILNAEGTAPAAVQNGRGQRNGNQRANGQANGNQAPAGNQAPTGNQVVMGDPVLTTSDSNTMQPAADSNIVTMDLSSRPQPEMEETGFESGLAAGDESVSDNDDADSVGMADNAGDFGGAEDDAAAEEETPKPRRAPRRRTARADTESAEGEAEPRRTTRRSAGTRTSTRRTSRKTASADGETGSSENTEEAAPRPRRSPRTGTGRTRRTSSSREKASADPEPVVDESVA